MASISLNQVRFDFASSSENLDSPNRLNSPMSSGHSTPIASSISTPIQAVKKGPNRGKKFYGCSWKADNCHYFVWEHKDEKVDLLIWKQEKKTLLTEIESLIADLKRIKEDKKMLEEKKALKLKKEKMKVEVEKTTKS